MPNNCTNQTRIPITPSRRDENRRRRTQQQHARRIRQREQDAGTNGANLFGNNMPTAPQNPPNGPQGEVCKPVELQD
jgi:hypothetical protein